MKAPYRDAVVFNEQEANDAEKNYSGWCTLAIFKTEAEAKEYCNNYNSYKGEDDVKCRCCEMGCTMTAYEYAHWNGKCAYQ